MRQATDLRSVAGNPQLILQFLIRGVHYNHRDLSILIPESGCLQFVSAGATHYALRSGADEFREMAEIII